MAAAAAKRPSLDSRSASRSTPIDQSVLRRMECAVKDGRGVGGSELALAQNATRIALQTVKERCCLLQMRINALEKENLQLNAQASSSDGGGGGAGETDSGRLRETVLQLTREKSQLAQHVLLVSDENKKLWSRLSHLSEELPKRIEHPVPNLARSQTFTYPSNFKRINEIEENGKEIKNSLEEMSLKLIDSFLIEKSEYVDQYEQMVEMQIGDNDADATACNSDSLAEIKKQLEKMNEIKRAAIQQQAYLKKYMTHLDLQTGKFALICTHLQTGNNACSLSFQKRVSVRLVTK